MLLCLYFFFLFFYFFFFFQAEDGIRDHCVTGVQTCALPISVRRHELRRRRLPHRGASLLRRELSDPRDGPCRERQGRDRGQRLLRRVVGGGREAARPEPRPL